MVTAAQMRKLALALPAVEEKSHFDKPDFRVRGKIFAGLSRDEAQGTLKLPFEVQAMVLDANPRAFSPAAGAWGRAGWTQVQLSHVRLAELETLLDEAWKLIAPPRLAAAGDGAKSATGRPAKSTKAARRRR